MPPEISVIIPTYNRREPLQRALQSVFRQRGVSFEVIVIDDGSRDETKEMIARNFPSATYRFQTNQGVSAARNQGIALAKAPWIAFLDSDDEWLEGKLQAQIHFAKENPSCLIHQTEEIWIRNGRRVNPMRKHQKRGGWIFEKSLELCLISPSAVMIHKKMFDLAGLFNEKLPACEDYDLWLRISSQFEVGLLSTPYVIRYGGHIDQLSRQYPAMDQFRIESICRLLEQGTLTSCQKQAAQNILQQKSDIYFRGAVKRKSEHKIAALRDRVFHLTAEQSSATHD